MSDGRAQTEPAGRRLEPVDELLARRASLEVENLRLGKLLRAAGRERLPVGAAAAGARTRRAELDAEILAELRERLSAAEARRDELESEARRVEDLHRECSESLGWRATAMLRAGRSKLRAE